MAQLEKIKEYIQEKEKKSIIWLFSEMKAEFDSLVSKETKETRESLHIFEWLKNDKNLLTYAELKNKEWELSWWEKVTLQLLEVKLSITCPYFLDFKDFLEELKKWESTPESQVVQQQDATNPTQSESVSPTPTQSESVSPSQSENTGAENPDIKWKQTNTPKENQSVETVTQIHEFCNLPLWEIQSYPYYKNRRTWWTWCSATAQMNWKNFGIDLPKWDAYNAWIKPWKRCICSIPENKKNKKPSKNRPSLKVQEFKSVQQSANFADIYVESKSNYGHRAVAFRDSTWQWYVLDPYIRVNWKLDNSPKKIEDYILSRKIVKSHFYKSNWYSDKELSYT